MPFDGFCCPSQLLFLQFKQEAFLPSKGRMSPLSQVVGLCMPTVALFKVCFCAKCSDSSNSTFYSSLKKDLKINLSISAQYFQRKNHEQKRHNIALCRYPYQLQRERLGQTESLLVIHRTSALAIHEKTITHASRHEYLLSHNNYV